MEDVKPSTTSMRSLNIVILAAIFILAFGVRLFAVIRYESVIHEFDPYFNYRATIYLIENGFEKFQNWFDDRTWYPIGRIVGGTLFPGLMTTAAILFKVLNYFHIFISIRDTCVFLAPFMAGLTAITAYFFGKDMRDDRTGLLAALLMALVPAYISRSVAGSYDNEAVSIFALLFAYLLWIKAVRHGSVLLAALTAAAYFYMAASWGAYVFIINLVPLYTLVSVLVGRYSVRLHVAYTTFYVLGIVMTMQIPFINYQPVQSAEHLAAAGIFVFMQGIGVLRYLSSRLPEHDLRRVFRNVGLTAVIGFFAVTVALELSGFVTPWSGRFKSFLDPTYAKAHIPIIASVSEHQPTTWGSFFFDLHILAFLVPAGVYFALDGLTDTNLFVLLYGVCAVYFSGVMIRMMLILAPVSCLLGALALSRVLDSLTTAVRSRINAKDVKAVVGAAAALVFLVGLLVSFTRHSVWATSEAYSSPSVVLMANTPTGRVVFDDFREAYSWLDHNTAEDAKVMSWWDYGYQLAQMSNRTTIVDNNTWNNTHIAMVGRAFAQNEDDAIVTIRLLDVDYVLVVFGGLVGYSSDDINKFLWMVRIGGGEFGDVHEQDYFNSRGQYTVDKSVSKTMRDSLMYRLCFHRFGEVVTDRRFPGGFDRVRNVEIGDKDIKLKNFEEVFTSQHWMVRIYKVKPENNW
ncbi:Oligosaccharyl transferase, STT3 subunit [Carpediemonas membranifera]|uniref:dolichyl-diphosphooligosaccharide--protein glycotransferase n=1 Tax=Carpediemonas membranifera TaxID=201153 RepID=A0A8J6BAU0_9EUKA|nr:Oligosaccharyl transferase, STT3 subunit [Carpediemonas membranifera]|eukprot:KAG9396377.1 Oligosaccharyl transferase, STT3 subunit [Carpediemonas membranifera]